MNNIDLEIDGKKIQMNDFVRKFLFGMISGSVGTLRDVGEDWSTINIRLKR